MNFDYALLKVKFNFRKKKLISCRFAKFWKISLQKFQIDNRIQLF